jgi:anti-sigma regulatory factor (Ser/Thr protein kinase)
VDGQILQFRLRGGDDAIPAARHVLDRVAEEYELPSFADLRLLVSELVTNSVVHAGAGPDEWVELQLRNPDGSLRVEVCDESMGWSPRAREGDLEDPGGWGLVIVDRLADRWGVSRNGHTCVWFELDGEGALRKRPPCRNASAETATQLVRTSSGTPAICDVCGELVTYSEGFARADQAVTHLACLSG